ncbi:MAG TPA: response regulator transcription factor [Verrucomicrobiae bacterium]|jgi:DNA-binding response OmpR family regulator|nr:response regulator transcription factor [Verrucomicrobiae bacterium]
MATPNQDRNSTGNAADRTRVLIIDDDRKLCRLIRDYLEPMGYDIEMAHTGPEGLEKALRDSFNAVILDLMLPGMDGFEVLKKLRHTSDVPVLMLTGRGEEPDRIVGLEIGADDYLPKTFSTRELLARLRAVTRRAGRKAADKSDPAQEIVVGPLRVRPESRVALLDNQSLVLTPVEFDLLACLAQAKGRVKTREQLLDSISDRNYDVFDRSIDVHISALRKKLGDDPKNPRFIRTLRVAGYLMIDPENDV